MIISIPSRLKNTFFLKFKTAVTNIRDMLLGFIFYLWFYILQQFLTILTPFVTASCIFTMVGQSFIPMCNLMFFLFLMFLLKL